MKKNYGMPAVKNGWQGYTKKEDSRSGKNENVPSKIGEILAYCLIAFSWWNYLALKVIEFERAGLPPEGFIGAVEDFTIKTIIVCIFIFVVSRVRNSMKSRS